MADLSFEKLPETKELQFVKTAGIHLGFQLKSHEWVEGKEKDGKKGNGYVKMVFGTDAVQFTVFSFSPPATAADVKFVSDHYEGGVVVRKKTEEEEIVAQFTEKFYMYEQLARAFNASKEKIDSFKAKAKGDASGLFKIMYDQFFSIFTKEFYADKKVNLKILWTNSKTKKTSNLNLAKPSAYNMVFAPYVNDNTPVLQLSAREEQNGMKRMFAPQDRAPDTNAAEVSEGNEGWKPVDETGNAAAGNTPAEGLF